MTNKGKAWIFGNNIDTDAIIPARYLNTSDPVELAEHCMEDADTTFAKNVEKGDIIVAGKNFGCGSSREHAPISIKTMVWDEIISIKQIAAKALDPTLLVTKPDYRGEGL